MNIGVLRQKLLAVFREQRARGVVEQVQQPDEFLALLDFLVVLLPVVVDADDLNESLFREEDCGDDDSGFEDGAEGTWPADIAIASECTNDIAGSKCDDGPEEKRDWDFQGGQNKRILSDSRADEPACSLEDERDDLSEELADPETDPDDLQPDKDT